MLVLTPGYCVRVRLRGGVEMGLEQRLSRRSATCMQYAHTITITDVDDYHRP